MITAATLNLQSLSNPAAPPDLPGTNGTPFAAIIGLLLDGQNTDSIVGAAVPALPSAVATANPALAQDTASGSPGMLHFVLPFEIPAKVSRTRAQSESSTESGADPQVASASALPPSSLQAPPVLAPAALARGAAQTQAALPDQPFIAGTRLPAATSPIYSHPDVMPRGNTPHQDLDLAFAARLTEIASAPPVPVTPANAPAADLTLGKASPKGPSLTLATSPASVKPADKPQINPDSEPSSEHVAAQKGTQDKPDSGRQDSDKSRDDIPPLQETVSTGTQHPGTFLSTQEATTTAPAATPAVKAPEATAPAAQLNEVPVSSTKSQPVRDLSFQIGAGTTNQVDVRIQDRSGEVRVAVHSANQDLSTDMRQQLGDLVLRLDRAGYHSETYKPSSETRASQSASESSESGQKDSSGERQQQQQDQPSGRQRKDTRPKWVQEMNGSLGSTPTQGAKY